MARNAQTTWSEQWPSLSRVLCKQARHFGRGYTSLDELESEFLAETRKAFDGTHLEARNDLYIQAKEESFYSHVIDAFRNDLAALTAASPSYPVFPSYEAVSLLIFAKALTIVSKRTGVQESPINQSLVRRCADACVADGPDSPFHSATAVEAAAFLAPNEAVSLAAEIGQQDGGQRREVARVAARLGWATAVPLLQEWARSSPAEISSLFLVCAARAGVGTSHDYDLTKQALEAAKGGDGAELEDLADWVIDRSLQHDDVGVSEILQLLSVRFPTGFNALPVTCETVSRASGCTEPRHWPTKIQMHIRDESPWPVGTRFLSGAACAAGLPDYAFALACHEYLNWEHDNHSWSATTGVAGPLLVMSMTARGSDIREECLKSLRDLLTSPKIELSSPSLCLSRAHFAARHYSTVGNTAAAITAIKEAVLLAHGPVTTTRGWHGLPVAGYEIFESRLCPDLDEVWRFARELGVEPSELTTTPARRMRTMLELARESLSPEGTARPDMWVAEALLLTVEENFDHEVVGAWAGSIDLIELSVLYLHNHPVEHDSLALWSAFHTFLNGSGMREYPQGFGPRSAAIQRILLDRLSSTC